MYNSTGSSALVFTAPDGSLLRSVLRDGEPWFVAIDACGTLGIVNSRDAVGRLDPDGVGSTDVIDSLGRSQKTTIVSESGLYELIFMSRKPEARAFTKWVTSEVLPSIRHTGSYGIGGTDAWTWHEFATVVREATGIEVNTSELKRLMRLAGILKETNAPKARWERDHFWFTGSAWTILKRPAWKLIARIARTWAELDGTSLLRQIPGPRRPEQLALDIPGTRR